MTGKEERFALELAEMVRKFWAAKGELVKVRVIQENAITTKGAALVFGLRSDLVNGLPPKVWAARWDYCSATA